MRGWKPKRSFAADDANDAARKKMGDFELFRKALENKIEQGLSIDDTLREMRSRGVDVPRDARERFADMLLEAQQMRQSVERAARKPGEEMSGVDPTEIRVRKSASRIVNKDPSRPEPVLVPKGAVDQGASFPASDRSIRERSRKEKSEITAAAARDRAMAQRYPALQDPRFKNLPPVLTEAEASKVIEKQILRDPNIRLALQNEPGATRTTAREAAKFAARSRYGEASNIRSGAAEDARAAMNRIAQRAQFYENVRADEKAIESTIGRKPPERVASKYPDKPFGVQEKRLRHVNTNDLYQAYGHEGKSQARRAGRDEYRKSKGYVGKPVAAAGGVIEGARQSRLARQGRFIRDQQLNRFHGIMEGTAGIHFKNEGERSNQKKGRYGLKANKEWEYVLRNKPKEDEPESFRKKRLDYEDVETQFHRGRRDFKGGKLKAGEWDEVAQERLVPKFGDTINLTTGKREMPGRAKPEEGVEEVFVPITGLKNTSTKTKPAPGKIEKEDLRPRLKRVEDQTAPPGEREFQEKVQLGRQRRYVYTSPEQLRLQKGEMDEVAVRLPGFSVGNREVGDRLAYLKLDDSTDRRAFMNTYVGGTLRAAQEYDMQQASRLNAWQQRMRNSDDENKLESRFKTIAAAGAGAAAYRGRDRIAQSAPTKVYNRVWDLAKKRGVEDKLDFINFPKAEHAVREGIKTPVRERWFLRKRMFKNPTMSMTDDAIGIEGLTRFRNRDWLISDPIMEARKIQADHAEVLKVSDVKKQVFTDIHSPSRAKRLLAKQRSGWQELPRYQEHGTRLDSAVKKLREDISNSPDMTVQQSTRLNTLRKLEQAQAAEKARYPSPSKAPFNPFGQVEPSKSISPLKAPDRPLGGFNPVRPGNELAIRPKSRPIRNAMNTRSGKIALGGVAVLGLAGTAHYAHHKIQQRKLDPQERTAYYNRILPKEITRPTLQAKKTSIPSNRFTREFRMEGIDVPYGARVGKKRTSIRPSTAKDVTGETYAKNLPIGLTGVRVLPQRGTSKGPVLGSMVSEATGTRRRTWTEPGQRPVVKGKVLPFTVAVGEPQPIKKTARNRRRVRQKERDDIIYAFSSNPGVIKDFYAGDKLADQISNPSKVDKVFRTKGDKMERAFAQGFKPTATPLHTSNNPRRDFSKEAMRRERREQKKYNKMRQKLAF